MLKFMKVLLALGVLLSLNVSVNGMLFKKMGRPSRKERATTVMLDAGGGEILFLK